MRGTIRLLRLKREKKIQFKRGEIGGNHPFDLFSRSKLISLHLSSIYMQVGRQSICFFSSHRSVLISSSSSLDHHSFRQQQASKQASSFRLYDPVMAGRIPSTHAVCFLVEVRVQSLCSRSDMRTGMHDVFGMSVATMMFLGTLDVAFCFLGEAGVVAGS